MKEHLIRVLGGRLGVGYQDDYLSENSEGTAEGDDGLGWKMKKQYNNSRNFAKFH